MPDAAGTGGSMNHTTYAVPAHGGTPLKVLAQRPSGSLAGGMRVSLLIVNDSAVTIYWGTSPTITGTQGDANSGFPIAAGGSFSDVTTTSPIYLISSTSGTAYAVVGEVVK